MLKIDENSSVGLRLAYRFWIELDRPEKFNTRKTMEEWTPKMESLFSKSGLDYAGFKWFLIWALRLDDPDGARYGNNFTARNLRAAREPMASLVKQFAMTFFEVFLPKADVVIPLLVEKREEEESDALLRVEAQAIDENVKMAAHGPMAGETVEEWITREFATLHDPDWRCPNCGYGGSTDPGAERTAWCPDCAEERQMHIDDDKEWMCGEVESVSELTKEWD